MKHGLNNSKVKVVRRTTESASLGVGSQSGPNSVGESYCLCCCSRPTQPRAEEKGKGTSPHMTSYQAIGSLANRSLEPEAQQHYHTGSQIFCHRLLSPHRAPAALCQREKGSSLVGVRIQLRVIHSHSSHYPRRFIKGPCSHCNQPRHDALGWLGCFTSGLFRIATFRKWEACCLESCYLSAVYGISQLFRKFSAEVNHAIPTKAT